MKNLIYVDNNATTCVADEVMEAMLPFFTKLYGNPSSMYPFALLSKVPIDKAREQVAKFINAERSDEIIFTGCGTESDNMAILGALKAKPDKKHFITSSVEHQAIHILNHSLEKMGYRVSRISVDEKGLLNLDELRNEICDDTALVSLMWANNETGVIFPIEEAAAIAAEKGVPFHTDAVQAAGKIEIDVQKIGIDLLSISGHKIHAPKGVGALYVKRGTRIRPFLIGGHQEHGRRAGTENVPGIVGFGKACELAGEFIEDEVNRVGALRDKLEAEILNRIPDTSIVGSRQFRTPNTTNIIFKYVEGEAILLMMADKGICASSGSACTSGSPEPSHVLSAMKVPIGVAHSAIRFSLSRYNTDEDIEFIINHLPPVIEKLREMSPLGPNRK